LGVEGEQYSETVQRALVDFGSEKSFARAVVSFEEHYGWKVGRTTLRHQTLQAAQDAASYLDERLLQATGTYEQAGMAPPQVPTMLMGLDGCEIRTGVYMKVMSEDSPRPRPVCRIARPISGCGWKAGETFARELLDP
jgi:hypothetical protein